MARIPTAARPYAKALLGLAIEQQRADAVRDDIDMLRSLARGSADFAAFLSSPKPGPAQRLQILARLFEGRIETLTLNFLRLLQDRKRIGLLAPVCEAFEALDDRRRGIVEVRIVAARPMGPEEVASIERKLTQRLKQRIRTSVSVDESLLGGFKIRVGDEVLDCTVANQLQALRRRLVGA